MQRQPRWWQLEIGVTLILLVSWCLMHKPANAQASLLDLELEFKLGPLEIHPGFIADVIYDDNIFLEESNKQADVITRLSPTLNLSLLPFRGRSRLSFSLAYFPGLNFLSYNRNEDYVSHDVSSVLVYDAPGGLLFTLSERFLSTREPLSTEEQSATGAARLPRQQNDFGFGVTYSVNPKSKIELRFVRTDYLFLRDRNDNLNRNENTITLTALRRILPKTSALLSYSFKYTDFVDLEPDELNKDNYQHTVSIGLRANTTAKVSGQLTIGYTIKLFEADTQPDDQPFDDNEQSFFTATELTWRALRRTQVSLLVSRNFQEASTENASSFNQTLVNLGIEQRFPFDRRFSASVHGIYEHDDFNTINRDDDLFQVLVSFPYQLLQWLSLAFRYEFATKSSDDPTVEYDVNRFIFTASVQW
jgi:hypothetical protein